MAFGVIIIGDEILSGRRIDKHLPKVIELLGESGAEARHLIRLYRQLLKGQALGEEVWRDLKIHLQLGVTKGTLE